MQKEFTIKSTRFGLIVRVRDDQNRDKKSFFKNPNAWRNADEGDLPEIMRRLAKE